MTLKEYVRQRGHNIRALARKAGLDETTLGRQVRHPDAMHLLDALRIEAATEGAISMADLREQYRIWSSEMFDTRVGKKIAKASASGPTFDERLIEAGLTRRKLEYHLSKDGPISPALRRKISEAFRNKGVAISPRDFERHQRGQ